MLFGVGHVEIGDPEVSIVIGGLVKGLLADLHRRGFALHDHPGFGIRVDHYIIPPLCSLHVDRFLDRDGSLWIEEFFQHVMDHLLPDFFFRGKHQVFSPYRVIDVLLSFFFNNLHYYLIRSYKNFRFERDSEQS